MHCICICGRVKCGTFFLLAVKLALSTCQKLNASVSATFVLKNIHPYIYINIAYYSALSSRA